MTNSSKDHFGRFPSQEFRANSACPLPKPLLRRADRQFRILLQIPRYFDLDSYTVNRGEKHLDDLLHELTQDRTDF